jgi:signal transduction histidine kinase
VRKRAIELTGAAAVLGAGGVLGVLGYHWLTVDDESPWWQAMPSVAIAWTFLVSGLIARWRRPRNGIQWLLLLVGGLLLVRKLQYSADSAIFTAGFAVGGLYAAAFAHVVLAYPAGRIRDRVERGFVAATYVISLLLPLSVLLVFDPHHGCLFNCGDKADRVRPHSLISVAHNHTLFTVVHDVQQIGGYGIAGVVFIALIARRLLRATPHARRRLTPLLVAGVAAGLRAISEAIFVVVSQTAFEGVVLFAIEELVQIAVPIALLMGLVRDRLAHAYVSDLVRELAATPPAELAGPVGRALGDPRLEVVYWMPSRRSYVDAHGRPYELPKSGSRRAATELARDGQPVAALVHDAALLEEQGLLDSICEAARLSLENARLHAELQAQLRKVRESRTRIVNAADEERERIERDLHDGAQQRLVALALDLRLAERELAGQDPRTTALLQAAVSSLQTAVEELRELAHGVYPSILTQSGLLAALEELATRTSVPVSVVAPTERFTAEVEATAYFVACEAVANAVKHAEAHAVNIEVVRDGSTLVVSVVDDGRGGADPDGSGLRGLADRLEARGGRLWVESPAGGPTRITGEIPCES